MIQTTCGGEQIKLMLRVLYLSWIYNALNYWLGQQGAPVVSKWVALCGGTINGLSHIWKLNLKYGSISSSLSIECWMLFIVLCYLHDEVQTLLDLCVCGHQCDSQSARGCKKRLTEWIFSDRSEHSPISFQSWTLFTTVHFLHNNTATTSPINVRHPCQSRYKMRLKKWNLKAITSMSGCVICAGIILTLIRELTFVTHHMLLCILGLITTKCDYDKLTG